MPTIDLVAGRQWAVKVPEIVRYMDAQWVRAFFETGAIRLTTYQRCREHESSKRRDGREGSAAFAFSNGGAWIAGRSWSGGSSYMLCASLLESARLMKEFESDAYFIIHDPIQFADAISRWIPGFAHGKIGPCRYRLDRSVQRQTDVSFMPPPPFDLSSNRQPSEDELKDAMEKLRQHTGQAVEQALDHDAYFCKDERFADEAEFRIVWAVPYAVNEPLTVICPEAIRFCSTNVTIEKPYAPPDAPVDKPTSVLAGNGSSLLFGDLG